MAQPQELTQTGLLESLTLALPTPVLEPGSADHLGLFA